MVTAAKKKVAKKPVPKARAVAVEKEKVSRFPTLTTDVTRAVVDEIPPLRNGGVERRLRYALVLGDIREKLGVGVTVQIATFVGPGGAAEVKRALERGDRPVDGVVGDWEFAARKVENANGVGSVLFATLIR